MVDDQAFLDEFADREQVLLEVMFKINVLAIFNGNKYGLILFKYFVSKFFEELKRVGIILELPNRLS